MISVSNYYSISYEDIQKEVQNYGGPVTVFFDIYDDFYFYKSG